MLPNPAGSLTLTLGPVEVAVAVCPTPGRAAEQCLAELLLRERLAALIGARRAADCILSRDAVGAPFVEGAGVPAVAISYSGGCVAVAAARCGAIGLDIEAITPLPPEEIPWHLLTPPETGMIRAAGHEAVARFLTIWTMKEARAKLLRIGLDDGFRDLDCADWCAAADGRVRLADGSKGEAGTFQIGARALALAVIFTPPPQQQQTRPR